MTSRPVSLVPRSLPEDIDPARGFVDAELLEDLEASHLRQAERQWSPYRKMLQEMLERAGVEKLKRPGSLGWSWGTFAMRLQDTMQRGFGVYRGFGIKRDQAWEGMMLASTSPYTAKLPGDVGNPLVCVERVEAAPWNWNIEELDIEGKFKGVGVIFFQAAVILSDREGFHGRIGLLSLPKAEGFYAKMGMENLGQVHPDERCNWFELSRERAQRYLEQWRIK